MRVGNPIRPVAVWLGGRAWLPRFAPYIVRLDMLIRRLSGGRISLLWFAGLPELFLTVAGRKSGLPRTTPLLCAPHEGGWLVAGSNWGQEKPPAWVGNLDAAETATVEFQGRETTVAPRRTQGAERAELWSVMLKVWPNYDKYALRTDREIQIFRLTPVE
jgi:deazaflavin-dependent oxidoreductase (nitroreductase family)